MVKTSIIIVNFNGAKVIRECLEKLQGQTEHDFEVILVDNGSVDESLSIIRKYFPAITVVALRSNKGFTGGNIAGLSYSKGRYICLLNPDTEVEPDWLENLVLAIDQHPEVGICASKLLVYGKNEIDSAGDGCTVTGKGYKRGEGEHSGNYTNEQLVFGACGGAMLIRRELIGEIGFLDDDFFLIHEDTDYNFRAQLAGWRCLYVPTAVVHHKVRSSIGHLSDIAAYYSIRNARYVWIKNMPLGLIVKYFPYQVLQEIGTFVYFVLKHRKLLPYLQANLDTIRGLPSLLKKRGEIMKLQKINTNELEKKLLPVFSPKFITSKIKKLFGTGQ
jgi:GT2 family glycosyltransferase